MTPIEGLAPCRSPPTPSPLDNDFRIVYRVTDLPAAISEILPPTADPGEPFNWSDAIDPGFPMRRLTFGGHSEIRAFVYFEQGGFVVSQGLIVFQFHGAQVTEVFSASINAGAKNIEQLRGFVERCEFIQ